MPTTPFLDLSTIHTPTVGGTPPASWGTAVRDNQLTLARPPGCAVATSGAGFSLTPSTWINIPFAATDRRDTDGFHDPGSNPDRITVPAGLGGFYAFAGQATIAGNSTGSRQMRLMINGSSARSLCYIPLTGSTVAAVLPISEVVELAAGDYVQLQIQSTASVALAGTSLMAMWMVAWP